MPKPFDWKRKDAEFTNGRALYLKNESLARMVYDAIQVPKFRLVVNGVVVSSKPASTTPCSDTAPKLWSSADFTWDDQGCLKVLDAKLAELIEAAKAAGNFRIDVPTEVTPEPPDDDGGGVGDSKVNAMCTC